MAIEPNPHRGSRPAASKGVMGCLGTVLFLGALGGGLLLCGIAFAVGWGGSYALARLFAFNQVCSAIAGAAMALVAAVLSVPLGTLAGSVLCLKSEGASGIYAITRSAILTAIFLPLGMFVRPHYFLPAWLLAPALCGWFFYSQPVDTAALWTGVGAPAIGVATGLFMVVADVGSDSRYGN